MPDDLYEIFKKVGCSIDSVSQTAASPAGHFKEVESMITRTILVAAAVALGVSANPANAAEFGKIDFPKTADGSQVLPVDFHTHTVFSDGFVWPTLRVYEAYREGLAGVAITDHLEWQRNGADVLNPDRNRSYNIALEDAKALADKTHTKPVLVIRGAEITRGVPPGHLNAVFLKDVNRLINADTPIFTKDEDFPKLDINTERDWQSFHNELLEAKSQGGFIILNHPDSYFDSNGVLNARDTQLVDEGLVAGIEVVNSEGFSEAGFNLALQRNLTIIGSSDLHPGASQNPEFLLQWTGHNLRALGMPHRTVTLVLTRSEDESSIHEALLARATVGLYDNQLIGRAPEIEKIVRGTLSLTTRSGGSIEGSGVVVTVSNGSSIPIVLRNVGDQKILNQTDIFTVPAHSSIELINWNESARESDYVALKVEILNAYIAPKRHPIMTLASAIQ